MTVAQRKKSSSQSRDAESPRELNFALDEKSLNRRLQLLEKYCLERKRDLLKRGIRELLAQYPDDQVLRERGLDWLWRAGLQREGIKFSLPKGDIGPGDITPEKLGRVRALWLMLFLIGQNGWPYAAQWLSSFDRIEASAERGLLAGILTELGEYERAWRLLEESRNDDDLQAWVIRAFIAWRGSMNEEGPEVCQKILSIAPREDRITRWWVTCLKAYFDGQAGQPRDAVQDFLMADQSFPNASVVAPRLYASSRIWLALLYAKAGEWVQAEQLFARAEQWYRHHLPDYVPVRVIDVYHWKSRVMALKSEELSALQEYPGPSPHLRRYRAAQRKKWEATKGDGDPSKADAKNRKPQWVIAPKADEYWFEGKPRLGVPLEIRLLAILKRSQGLGVHRNLVKALLWPHELRVYFQLDGRLSKLIERLRVEHGFEIQSDRECYSLVDSSRGRVDVDRSLLRPSFFQHWASSFFTWENVAEYYNLGPTQARAALKEWLTRNWIDKEGAGRLTRYRVRSGKDG